MQTNFCNRERPAGYLVSQSPGMWHIPKRFLGIFRCGSGGSDPDILGKRKNDLKWKIMHDFVMAEVHTRFNFREEKQDIPHPWEYYPELFREEEQHYVKKKACDELESYKEARKEYAAEFNRRRRQGV